MKTIAIITVSRSDFGIYTPILRKINSTPDLKYKIIASGMHLSREYGYTIDEIVKLGFRVYKKIEMLMSSDSPEGIGKSISQGVNSFAQLYSSFKPDILLVLGDRYEMLSAVIAALPFNIPIAHIHGGEVTEGAFDEQIRHSITKISHIHFASTETYRRRIVQMGEEPWRVVCSGAPSLDNLKDIKILTRKELEKKLNFSLCDSPILATFHPTTREYNKTSEHITNFLNALKSIKSPIIFTYPNSDTNATIITNSIKKFVEINKNTKLFTNLGTELYFSMMKHCAAMVGNSSSGIIEAASFELPVVNVGCRQQGRIHSYNVINTKTNSNEILNAINKAKSPLFRKKLAGMKNPYGDGKASEKIVKTLKKIPINQKLLTKKFYDVKQPNPD